jgi:hypothetical protein
MQDMQNTNFAISKKLLKDKMTATFRVSDPFNTQRFAFDLEGENYIQDISRRRDTRTFTLGLTWRFGELKTNDRPRKEQMPREEMDMGF